MSCDTFVVVVVSTGSRLLLLQPTLSRSSPSFPFSSFAPRDAHPRAISLPVSMSFTPFSNLAFPSIVLPPSFFHGVHHRRDAIGPTLFSLPSFSLPPPPPPLSLLFTSLPRNPRSATCCSLALSPSFFHHFNALSAFLRVGLPSFRATSSLALALAAQLLLLLSVRFSRLRLSASSSHGVRCHAAISRTAPDARAVSSIPPQTPGP